MKPRWAPRWFQWVGIGPNPALPSPKGDNTPMPEPTPDEWIGKRSNLYRWLEAPALGPKEE